jgi:ETC complex I subunit conserved region
MARVMTARIFQRPKNAMQSGKARTDDWVLEFAPAEAKQPDPLMGWAGSGDMRQQVQLAFATRDEALAYAARHGIAARLFATPPRRLKLQAYADNFR